MLDFVAKLFDSSGFPPRWNCGSWSNAHGWLHILSDLGVWSAYVAIPCVLAYFVVRRRDVPFRGIFLLFIAFILACGTTHLMEAIIFWWPGYRLAGVIKLFTAIISWCTVLALIPIVPKALALRSAESLEREVAARREAERALQEANAELERRVAERTAALAESDRRKNEFLAVLAHELRNPLAPIRNGLQVISLTEDREAWQKVRAMMERQLAQMVRMVDDLLDVSRISRNKIDLRITRVALTSVLENAIETARPHIEVRGHTLTVNTPAEPVYLEADLTRLAQVFWNLLSNAAKYTNPGGRIELTATADDDEVRVGVKDNGIGIPSGSHSALFTIFSQLDHSLERAQGGLGIGLALVKGLVELHGGQVEVHSEGAGQGSEFAVRLPRNTRIESPATNTPPARIVKPRRILVVDDNRDAAASLAMILAMAGHDTRTAYDGVEALELAEAFRPEVILLDIGMPRMNGYDVCRKLRGEDWGSGIILVAVTGWGQEEDRQRSINAGFDQHMVKPLNLEALEELMVASP